MGRELVRKQFWGWEEHNEGLYSKIYIIIKADIRGPQAHAVSRLELGRGQSLRLQMFSFHSFVSSVAASFL